MEDQEVQKFEPLVSSLQDVISKLEQDDIELDAAMAAYERGIAILRKAQAYLSEAEQRIQLIEANGEQGSTLGE